MGRKKEYCEVRCDCEQSTHYAIAICEEARIDEFKHRIVRSVADFIDTEKEEFTFKLSVKKTTFYPTEGVDILIKPYDAEPTTPIESEISIVKLED